MSLSQKVHHHKSYLAKPQGGVNFLGSPNIPGKAPAKDLMFFLPGNCLNPLTSDNHCRPLFRE